MKRNFIMVMYFIIGFVTILSLILMNIMLITSPVIWRTDNEVFIILINLCGISFGIAYFVYFRRDYLEYRKIKKAKKQTKILREFYDRGNYDTYITDLSEDTRYLNSIY